MRRKVYIAGTGSFLPGEPVPFSQIGEVLGPLPGAPLRLQRWMEQTAPVMQELLAIKRTHFAIDPATREPTEDNVTMATKASRAALEAAALQPHDVDLICYGSAHQDQMPTASVRIQEALGIEVCDELSIHANCTSAYKALYLAHELIAAGKNDCALAVSSSIASSELRAEYYNQALVDKDSLFLRWFLGDGAGAVVLTADPCRSLGYELCHSYIESVGGKRPSLMFNRRPALWLSPKEEYEQGLHHLCQSFRGELATSTFQEEGGSVFLHGLLRMLDEAMVALPEISLFQVNLPARHIAESVMDELEARGLPRQRHYTKIHELGYCGPPMVFVCLDHMLAETNLPSGAYISSFVTEVSKFMQAGYVARRHD
jgi:3-oxoacyl-[acyl-carrier-protein] synthase III